MLLSLAFRFHGIVIFGGGLRIAAELADAYPRFVAQVFGQQAA